jgi:hypothetical protein
MTMVTILRRYLVVARQVESVLRQFQTVGSSTGGRGDMEAILQSIVKETLASRGLIPASPQQSGEELSPELTEDEKKLLEKIRKGEIKPVDANKPKITEIKDET